MLTPDENLAADPEENLPNGGVLRRRPIEIISMAGYGGEARVFLHLRNVFPGPGGTVVTEQDIATAFRFPNGRSDEEFLESESPEFAPIDHLSRGALRLFIKHVILKKLDDYFFRSEVYGYAHIPRPLGCTTEGAYMYEWVFGSEGAPLDYLDENFNKIPLFFDEERCAAGAFRRAGIDILRDTKDSEVDRRKNIIIEESGLGAMPNHISCLWKRIDFGGSSIGFDAEKVLEYLEDNYADLIKHLGEDRVEMMRLGAEALLPSGYSKDTVPDRLLQLLYDYRVRTAEHMGVEAISPRKERTSPEVLVLNPEDELKHEEPTVIRRVRLNSQSELRYEIRREFPSIDGTIFTHQHIAIARITRGCESEPDFGFRLFLRHFLVKKLENAFISMGKYDFAHVPRPLGSENLGYLYEWVEGEAICPKECIIREPGDTSPLLPDWHRFADAFRETGIELERNIRWIRNPQRADVETAKQIILRQPYQLQPASVLSRLWCRVNYHEQSVSFDFDALERYLKDNGELLLKHLSAGRYETMVRALRYFDGTLSPEGYGELCQGIQDYRRSALRHLNYRGFSR